MMSARRRSATTTHSMRDTSHGLIEARVPGGGPPGTIIGAQLAFALSLALTLSVSGQPLRARLRHAEAHVDPVIKSGPLADAEEGLDVIEEVIDALIVGGGVGVRMCERSLSRARAKAQTDRSHRCRHHGQTRKFLESCEPSSHDHSLLKSPSVSCPTIGARVAP